MWFIPVFHIFFFIIYSGLLIFTSFSSALIYIYFFISYTIFLSPFPNPLPLPLTFPRSLQLSLLTRPFPLLLLTFPHSYPLVAPSLPLFLTLLPSPSSIPHAWWTGRWVGSVRGTAARRPRPRNRLAGQRPLRVTCDGLSKLFSNLYH